MWKIQLHLMKEYHTQIDIEASPKHIWKELVDFEQYETWNPLVKYLKGDLRKGGSIRMFIIPLNQEFKATLTAWEQNKELTWLGIRFGSLKFLLSGEHYFRIESTGEGRSRLYHGEYFRGWFSAFIPKKLLKKMKNTFEAHNQELKKRIEDGK